MEDLTAVLLCGGKGERLRPLTESIPKPLVELNGRPILYHLMYYLGWSGIRRFILCVGHRWELIQEFTRTLPTRWKTTLVNSGDATMTDRLLDSREHIEGQFLICYGDTLADVDLAALRAQHSSAQAALTITVYPLQSPFGIVAFGEDAVVTGFQEKPVLPYWINMGFMLAERETLNRLTRGSDMPEFLSGLARAGNLRAYRHRGRHLTVNTPKDLAQAEVEIREFYTHPTGS